MEKSRLDQLWHAFKGVSIQDTPSEVPSDKVILTESAIRQLIRASQYGMVRLEYIQNPSNPDLMQLIGYDSNESAITTVNIDKGITNIIYRPITQVDIDNGVVADLNTPALELIYVGKTKVIPLNGTSLKGSTTNTIQTDVISDTIKSNLLIDSGNNKTSSVQLKVGNNGVYSKLNIDNSSSITLEETVDGLSAKLHLVDSDQELKFDSIPWEEYNALENKINNTIYLISNKSAIYFNGQEYTIQIDQEVFDSKFQEIRDELQQALENVSGGLKSVELNGNNLIFVYATTQGDQTISVDLSKYIDVYQAGDNITIVDNVISADVPVKRVGLTQSVDGLYLALNDSDEAVPFPIAQQDSDGNYQCGIMSKENAEKLDNLPTNMDEYAKKAEYKVKTLGIQKSTGGVSLLINGTNELPIPHAAMVSGAYETGLMEGTDKEKLDSIDTTKLITQDNIEHYAPSFTELDNKADVDSVYTKQEIDSTYAKKSEIPAPYDDTAITERVATLEAIDHSQYLTEHQDISGKVDKVEGKGLSTNDFTDELKNSLNSATTSITNIQESITNIQSSISGETSNFYTKSEIDNKLSTVKTYQLATTAEIEAIINGQTN